MVDYPNGGVSVGAATVPGMTTSAVPAQLGIVTLGVSDLARAQAFYSALGWRLASSSVPGAIAWFETAHSWLGLYGWAELAGDAAVPAAGDGFRGVTLACNVDSEQAVDQAMAAAQQAGASVVRPASHTEWGGYRGYFADPDGHLWEIAHNPGFPIRPDGRLSIP